MITRNETQCNIEGGEKMKDVRNMYTYYEVMERYGITSRSTIHRWVRLGLLKPTKIGGRVYFTEYALKSFEKGKVV